jgi:hypothetical protein
LDDYLIYYNRLLYVFHVNSMKHPTFYGVGKSLVENRACKPKLENRIFCFTILVYGLSLFCASDFLTRKHEFGELNSWFSVCGFIGSARDNLT